MKAAGLNSINISVRERSMVCASELWAYLGLFIWTVQIYIDHTGFSEDFGGRISSALRLAAIILFTVKIFLDERRIQIKALFAALFLAALVLIISRKSGAGIALIQTVILVYAVKDVNFKRICKVLFWSCLICYGIALLGYATGLTAESANHSADRVRAYLGFTYFSYPGIYFLNIMFTGLYAYTDVDRSRKNSGSALWIFLIVLEAVSFWIYRQTDTNIPFAVGTVFLLLYILTIKFGLNLFKPTRVMQFLAGVIYPVLGFVCYEIALHYNNTSTMWVNIDKTLTHNRIRLSHEGIERYGVHLIGRTIQFVPGQDNPDYFYLDSAYIRLLVNYGLIFFAVIMVYYAFISVMAVRAGDRVLCCWMVCVALYSIFNNMIIYPVENAGFLAIWYSLTIYRKNKRKRIKEALQS